MLHITGHFTYLNRFHIEWSPLFDDRFNIFTGGRHCQFTRRFTPKGNRRRVRIYKSKNSSIRNWNRLFDTHTQNEQIDQLSIILSSPVVVLLMSLLEMAVYDRLPAKLFYNALRARDAQTNTDSILAEIFQSIQTKHRLVEGDLFRKKKGESDSIGFIPIRK